MRSTWPLSLLIFALLWNAGADGDEPRRRHADMPPVELELGLEAGAPVGDCAVDFEIAVGDVVQGTTCGAENTTTDYGACAPEIPYPGPDHLYRVEPTRFAQHGNILLEAPGADLALFLLSSCDAGSSCFSASDYYYPGTIEMVEFGSFTTGELFLYVDSFYAAGKQSCGGYEIGFSTWPVELLEFTIE